MYNVNYNLLDSILYFKPQNLLYIKYLLIYNEFKIRKSFYVA